MSIVKLVNLNKNIILGKAAKVTSPSVAVGGKIISDAFGGGKIQPKGISEVSEYNFVNKNWQGMDWLSFSATGLPTEMYFTKEYDGRMQFTFQAHNFFINNAKAANWYTNLKIYIFLDDVQLNPYHSRYIYTLAGIEQAYSVNLSCIKDVKKGVHKLQARAGIDTEANMNACLIGTPYANIILLDLKR